MKVYDVINKDMDSMIKFLKEMDVGFNCDICKKYGFKCEMNCTDNVIKYLQMEVIEDNTSENELSQDDFNKFMECYVRRLSNKIGNIDVYTEVNYIRNHLRGLKEEGIKLNNNQKKLLGEELIRIGVQIDHLETLRDTINEYKEVNHE